MSELAKTYDPSQVEDKWYQYWEQHGLLKSVPDARPSYTIVIPPPNVTGVLHMGHMLNNTIQDVLIRRKRLEGYNACWVPGYDHASIATEAKVVQKLRAQTPPVTKQTLIDEHGYEGGRDAFLKEAVAWKDQYGGIILQQLRKLGAACDWDRTCYTMSRGEGSAEPDGTRRGMAIDYHQDVIDTFIKLHADGYIYRAERMVNWDPVAKTTLSDEEVIYKERTDKLYYVRYKYAEGEGHITVATTRPETIFADTAIAVHPDDERYKALVGKKVLVPYLDTFILVVTDESIDPEFGTGCLKVTPGHSKADFEIYERLKKKGIEIPCYTILTEDAHLDLEIVDGLYSEFHGLSVAEGRKKFSAWLDANGHLEKAEDLHHSVGHSERTDAVVEDRLSLQWWVDMKRLAKPALDAVMNGEVELVPKKFINTYKHWMENVKDWCISRQLWWGHRIPAWYSNVTFSSNLVELGLRQTDVINALERKLEYVGVDPNEAYAQLNDAAISIFGRPVEELFSRLEFVQDHDVLDTWFSSWLWPISVFNGLQAPNNAEFNYYYPTATLVTAPEILFFWVARMIIAGYYYGDKLGWDKDKRKPFQHVYLTGIVRDKLGRKMSKSLGNSPDPLELITKYSADGVRMGMLLSSPAGNDLLFDESACEQGRNFANKIWNAFRLVDGLGEGAVEGKLTANQSIAVAWLDARIAEVAVEVARQYEEFRLSEMVNNIYKLIWDDFCSWYLELMKPEPGAALTTTAHAAMVRQFEVLLQLLSPVMPFITEEIWHLLGKRAENDCILGSELTIDQKVEPNLLDEMATVRELVTALRALRTERGISMKESIDLFIFTSENALFEKYLDLVQRFVNAGHIAFWQVGPPPKTAIVQVRNHTIYVPVTINVDSEREKLLEEVSYLEGFLKSVEAKLGNEKFVANAKGDVVERERQKQADALAKLESLRKSLAQLG